MNTKGEANRSVRATRRRLCGALVQLLAEQGYPKDTLLFFDNGYSEIADTLRHWLIEPHEQKNR